MKINIPEFSLVAMVGASGSGKSSFAAKHFLPTEVISSDACRGMVSDNENDQNVTPDAFDILYYIAGKRLSNFKFTVIDATNSRREDRKKVLSLAREHHCLATAIVLNTPERICQERNRERSDRNFGPHVVRNQSKDVRRAIKSLKREGFRYVYVLNTDEEIETAEINRQPLWNNLKHENGPFDIIGDVHGCFDELAVLFEKLGYTIQESLNENTYGYEVIPPVGRKAVFLGDLVDRGPKNPQVLRLVMGMVKAGSALCVPGNHDDKLQRKLKGRNVRIPPGLAVTLEQLKEEPEAFVEEVADFLEKLISHYLLDEGRLVVAHAGMKASLQGRGSRIVREFALYGETTGESDELGLPIRYPWANEYRGKAMVVYGHTPVPEPIWTNNTINIDTGCAFGGSLTALRYPEKELVSVPAQKTYMESPRKFLETDQLAPQAMQPRAGDYLDIEDVSGKRSIDTRLGKRITIREENAAAALEVISRFAVNPKWLIYLPPTMSPSKTSQRDDYLEHPEQAFDYFLNRGVPKVICEQKHMGSRAIVVICRSTVAAQARFNISEDEFGVCYTRTGRRFFNDLDLEKEFLKRLQSAVDASNLWETLQSDWLVLDCELMPWSAKAQELLKRQYAAVGTAAISASGEALEALNLAAASGLPVTSLLQTYQFRAEAAEKFKRAYRHYCWPVNSLNDLKLAPFHILASEGNVHIDKDHLWHMETLSQLCLADEELLLATEHRIIEVTDDKSRAEGIAWWEEITANGGEGMVVKPLDFIAKENNRLLQPAIKSRGKEYLRIIYGPEYAAPENLERLRKRGLGRKRGLAEHEFALGIEALERFVRKEPLYRVHECVFGVLALESNPVDPRL